MARAGPVNHITDCTSLQFQESHIEANVATVDKHPGVFVDLAILAPRFSFLSPRTDVIEECRPYSHPKEGPSPCTERGKQALRGVHALRAAAAVLSFLVFFFAFF